MRRLLVGLVLLTFAFSGCDSTHDEDGIDRTKWKYVYRSKAISDGARVPYRHLPHESRPITKARCEITNGDSIELSLIDGDDVVENSMLTLKAGREFQRSHILLTDSWQVNFPGSTGKVYTVATGLVVMRGLDVSKAVITIQHYADFDVDEYLSQTKDNGAEGWADALAFLRSMQNRRIIQVIEIEF
jgi:hypothetical protein